MSATSPAPVTTVTGPGSAQDPSLTRRLRPWVHAHPLVAIVIAWLVFVLALVLDQAAVAPNSWPTLSLAAGVVAWWIVLAGSRALPAVLGALPLVIGDLWFAGSDTPAAIAGGVAVVGAGAGAGALLWRTGTRMRRIHDPLVLSAAAVVAAVVVVLGQAAAETPVGESVAAAGAAFAGTILVLTAVLSVTGTPAQLTARLALLTSAVAAAALVPQRLQLAYVPIGLLAWLVLPAAVALGWRYGRFPAVALAGVAGTAGVSATAGDPLTTAGLLLGRQVVAGLLLIAVITALLFVSERRRILRRLFLDDQVLRGFQQHAVSMWYVKIDTGDGLHYEQIGGGLPQAPLPEPPTDDTAVFGEPAAAAIEASDREVLRSGRPSRVVETLPHPGGGTWTVLSQRFPITDERGVIVALGGVRTDVTEQEELRRRNTELLEAMFVRSPIPSLRVTFDAAGAARVEAINDALCRIIGRPALELTGVQLSTLVIADDWPHLAALLHPGGERRWSPQAEVRIHTRIGGHRRGLVTVVPLLQHTDLMLHVEDVTARRAAEEAVAWYALFDSVTGLLNRTAMGDRLDAALHRLGDGDRGVALVTVDIDEFKTVNDRLGHAAGDLVLAELGRRLRRVGPARDSVARLGADEFAVVLEYDGHQAVPMFVGRLQSALTEEFVADGQSVSVTASFGVAQTRDPEMTAAEMVRQAELALFRAKRLGRGRVEFYAESMRVQAEAVLNVRTELAAAVAGDRFVVAYQPILDLATGTTVGYEALVRLPTSDGKLLGPGGFLDVARSADMITAIDRQVLRRALTDLAAGRLPVPSAGLSVNAEPDDLRDPDFAIEVLALLHASQVSPDRLTLEVTEAALLDYDEDVLANVAALREVGVRFAIDDFGTGYSSLAQLRRLNADVIKIDRSFVMGMETNEGDANIVATVVSLAHQLSLVAVAEGVETREQAEALRRLGCDRGQGYLFGHPTPLEPTESRPQSQPHADAHPE